MLKTSYKLTLICLCSGIVSNKFQAGGCDGQEAADKTALSSKGYG